jgi:hypothetical protein
MSFRPYHRSKLRRILVAGGLLFVGAASLVLIAYQELDLPLPPPRLSSQVVLAGRLFTKVSDIEVGGVLVHFRRPEPTPAGRRKFVETAVTDGMGNFTFATDFRGPAHIFLDRHRMRQWTHHPISDIALPTIEKLEIELIDGPIATGRVVRDRLPVTGIGVALKFVEPAANDCFWLFREVTDDQGRFRFEHLPEGVEFWLSALRTHGFDPQPTEELPDGDTFLPVRFRSGTDGTILDLGDLELLPGATIAGKVVLADRKRLPENCVVAAGQPGAGGWICSYLDATGHFRIKGLPRGTIGVRLELKWTVDPPSYPVPPAGYKMSRQNACLDPVGGMQLIGRLECDKTDLTILVEPTKAGALGVASAASSFSDPAIDARFKTAQSGPISGIEAIH